MYPIHEPTEETRELVKDHARVGTPQDTIADILGIAPKTLRKHYRPELDFSTAEANAVIGGSLFTKAKDGDTAAQIFWMKTRAGWRETSRIEATGADGGPIQTEDAGVNKLALYLDTISSRTSGESDE